VPDGSKWNVSFGSAGLDQKEKHILRRYLLESSLNGRDSKRSQKLPQWILSRHPIHNLIALMKFAELRCAP
jgi:hypothetical protein